MAKNDIDMEKDDLTGLSTASKPKDAEMDILSTLLEMADFRNDDDEITEFEINRKGKHYLTIKLRPLSDTELRKARKQATIYMKNPNGKKLPPVEKELDTGKYYALLILAASSEEDQKNIWGNKKIMEKFDLVEPWESVDVLLKVGEKVKMVETILDISGVGDDEDDADIQEYAGN